MINFLFGFIWCLNNLFEGWELVGFIIRELVLRAIQNRRLGHFFFWNLRQERVHFHLTSTLNHYILVLDQEGNGSNIFPKGFNWSEGFERFSNSFLRSKND